MDFKIMSGDKKQAYDPIWQAFKKGDKQAFSNIYKTYANDLLNYGYKVTVDRKLIEDSIQDLFLNYGRTKKDLAKQLPFDFIYLKRFDIKYRTTKDNFIVGIDGVNLAQESLVNFSHESYLIELEVQSFQVSRLQELINTLPQRQQEAINLRYYHNFSNEEIAQIMGINYQSACKFIYTALKNLKVISQVSARSLFLKYF